MSARPIQAKRAGAAARWVSLGCFVAGLLASSAGWAGPITPRSADEVVEVLPAAAARPEERRLRKALAERPGDVALATALARRYLDLARTLGDPRQAGLALAALQPWSDPTSAPIEVLLLQATLDQHLHEFDTAAVRLEQIVKRDPRQAQAWLTLATVRRVQGRYDLSDGACHALAAAGAALHASACLAENDGLRGRADAARSTLQRLAATPRLDAATRGWLLTTLAELEQRNGTPEAARSAWAAALYADADSYAALGYADFLIGQGQDAQALAVLKDQPTTDAVLLRRAIAGTRSAAPGAADDVRELRARITQANLRPDTPATHGREQSMFALRVEHDPQRALSLARENLRRQREPIDLLVLAQAARAAGSQEGLRDAERLRSEQGLVDRRLAALL